MAFGVKVEPVSASIPEVCACQCLACKQQIPTSSVRGHLPESDVLDARCSHSCHWIQRIAIAAAVIQRLPRHHCETVHHTKVAAVCLQGHVKLVLHQKNYAYQLKQISGIHHQ